MNHRIAVLALSLGLAASPAAFADNGGQEPEKKAPQPVQMSEAQLDNVSAGALINAVLVDVVEVRDIDIDVAIPVNAAVAANVLGGGAAAGAVQPGRVFQ
jgi:hypothetical protein